MVLKLRVLEALYKPKNIMHAELRTKRDQTYLIWHKTLATFFMVL